MNFNLFYSLVITILSVTICPSSSAYAAPITDINSTVITASVPESTLTAKGGPRETIVFYSGIKVIQPSTDNLNIKILDDNGTLVHQAFTNKITYTLSTSGWTSGDYTVETVDDFGDYQAFEITIE